MKGKFFGCMCGYEGLWVSSDECGVEFALLTRTPVNMGWNQRVRCAWSCLKGKPYTDQVILDHSVIKSLAAYLNEDHCKSLSYD